MEENENQNLKELAEETLLRSIEEVSDDKEIIQHLRDKVIIIKESNKIEVKYPDIRPLTRIPLYLIGKFIGYKVLKVFDSPAAKTEELASNLNLPSQALSRPLGILAKDLIDSSSEGYKIRAYKILNFLNSLDNSEITEQRSILKSKSIKRQKSSEETEQISLSEGGIKKLVDFLEINEPDIRRLIFFRENEAALLNTKIIPSKENVSEQQLNASLIYLLVYKYSYNLKNLSAGLLREKLQKIGIPSLVNLSTNLRKFTEFIFHQAGPLGSHKNYYIITPAGEEEIKHKIRLFLRKNE